MTPPRALALLLCVPLLAAAQDTTTAPATPASMAGTSTAPAPAAQEPASAPRRPGETTTGRPPAPTVPVPATTPAVSALPASPTTSPGAGGLLQTILALTFVLALLAGLAWLLKRYGPRPGGGGANLRVVGALNLGGRERIMVVEVGDQWIVVGAAPGRVNALHTMPRQEGELTPVAAHGGLPATNFSDWLKKTIDKRNAT